MYRIISIIITITLISFNFSIDISEHNYAIFDFNNENNFKLLSDVEQDMAFGDFLLYDSKSGFGNYFIKNNGQVRNGEVVYYIQGQRVWLTDKSIAFELRESTIQKTGDFNKFNPIELEDLTNQKCNQYNSAVVIFEFLNSNNVIPIGVKELKFKSNFFYGNDSDKWYTDVPNYGSIIYKNIYNNIDLKYYFNEARLKYDFIVHPGGKPEDIMVKVEGAEELILRTDNSKVMTQPLEFNTSHITYHTQRYDHSDIDTDSLTIKTGLADIVDSNLFAYQEYYEKTFEVPIKFNLINSNCYGFTVLGDYDKEKTLVIDPLIYSTYIGGSDEDICYDLKTDSFGNTYITGSTGSSNFPVTPGSNDTSINGNLDVFVTKLDADGTSPIYSTFIGGNLDEEAYSIELDSNGSAYIAGYTYSSNFPTTPNAYSTLLSRLDDVFACKLSPDGDKLNFSTYFGGWWYDRAFDLVLDKEQNIYLTGYSCGTEFLALPITPGVFKSSSFDYYNVFITKLSSNGTDVIHSTLIGTFHDEFGWSIALDKEDNICIAGFADNSTFPTDNSTFPTTPGAYCESYSHDDGEGFLLKLNANMSTLLYSTFIGRVEHYWEWYGSTDLLITEDDDIIITGNTKINSYPTTQDAFDPTFNGNWDVLILKFNANLSSLDYATYLGGRNTDVIYDSMLDTYGNVIMVGNTNSSDFPVLQGVFDSYYNANMDVFVSILNITDSQLRYSTYLGSNGSEYGYSVAEDQEGNLLIAGQAESGFPTTENSFDPNNNGFFDSFLCKLSLKFKPVVLDLSTSKESVYRSEKIQLYSSVIDKEDFEVLLTPYFEYKLSEESINWSTVSLSTPLFVNDEWQCTLTVPNNTTLGYYDLRIRYKDTDDMWSPWTYAKKEFLVKNNPPKIEFLKLSKNLVYKGDNLSISTSGSDVENELEKLTFFVENKHQGTEEWKQINNSNKAFTGTGFEFNFTVTSDMQFGYYDIRVRVNDTDFDFSSWVYMNSSFLYSFYFPTILSLDVFPAVINRTESVDIYTTCSDGDTRNEDLDIVLQFKPESEEKWQNLSSVFTEGIWVSKLTAESNWLTGKYYFRIRAVDIDDHASLWFYLNNSLTVLNNIPVLDEIENIPAQMYRGNNMTFSIGAADIEDEESELSVEIEYKEPGGKEWLSTYFATKSYSVKSWKFDFVLPLSAKLGTYCFRVRISDMDNDWSDYNYLNNSLTVINANPIITLFEQTPNEVLRTGEISITARGNDLETNMQHLECLMHYQTPESELWEQLNTKFNESTGAWETKLITSIQSILGNYSFKIQFRDFDGALSNVIYTNNSVWVKNNLPIISLNLDDIHVGKIQYRFNLTGYGIDIETSKNELKWFVDESTINTNLFHIDMDNIENQELLIYPKKSIEAEDEITIILVDSDNGKAVKKDVTIIVNSKSEDGVNPSDEKNTITNRYWIYVIVIIIIIALIVLFIFYRRKKQKEKEEREKEEERVQELEETQTESTDDGLSPDAESASPEVEAPKPVPVPVIEETTEPVPVPMPLKVPQLPAAENGIVEDTPYKSTDDVSSGTRETHSNQPTELETGVEDNENNEDN